MSSVDPAILNALGLDPSRSEIASHGGSGFSSTFKISSTLNGKPVKYFVKTRSDKDSEVMFRGEHASLNAIHDAVPNFCPKSHAYGATSTPGKFFLITDFLDLGSSAKGGSGLSIATKLARLHSTPGAAPPPGQSKPMFGFPVPTCCGATVQENPWTESWADFYANHRLRSILSEAERNNGHDEALANAVETVAARVVPRLLREHHLRGVVPVVVHGDLWSGNHSRGQIAGQGGCEEVVYDPSAVYGHSEYDLGIMKMFGGFTSHFWNEYQELMPKAEPVGEWEDRIRLYELYHHLNHYAMFGGGYRMGAMSIMKKLIAKYGS